MYQQMIVQGRVAADPVIQYGQDGTASCEFDVKVVKEWKNSNKETLHSEQWFRVRAIRALGETIASDVKRDTPVLVVGEISVTAEQAAKGEKPIARMRIFAQSVTVIEGATGAGVVQNDNRSFDSKAPKTAWDEAF